MEEIETEVTLTAAESEAGQVLGPNTIVDHYRVLRLIGRGGMGEVYLASQLPPQVELFVDQSPQPQTYRHQQKSMTTGAGPSRAPP